MYLMYTLSCLYGDEFPGKSDMATLAIFVPVGGGSRCIAPSQKTAVSTLEPQKTHLMA